MKAEYCSFCGPRPALTAGIPPSLPPSRRLKWYNWDLHREWWSRGQILSKHNATLLSFLCIPMEKSVSSLPTPVQSTETVGCSHKSTWYASKTSNSYNFCGEYSNSLEPEFQPWMEILEAEWWWKFQSHQTVLSESWRQGLFVFPESQYSMELENYLLLNK